MKIGGAPFTESRMTGAARSSSARAVKCSVQSGNERNPYRLLNFSGETAPVKGRKVGMTSDQRGPYILGDTRATMAITMGCNTVRWS